MSFLGDNGGAMKRFVGLGSGWRVFRGVMGGSED